MTDEQHSLDQQIANLTKNLDLIEQRVSEFVLSTDVPLQLLRDKARVEAQLAELTARRDHLPDQGDLPARPTLDDLPLDIAPALGPLPPAHRLQLAPNPLFVGREEELQTLAATLKAGGDGAVAAATGAGGIGKSQLAVEFAHRYGRFFSGGLFWLSFADAAGVANEIAQCGLAMPELPTNLADLPLDDQVRLVRQAWQSPSPRLLIFDNCEDAELFTQWRPSSGGCRILLTSRRAVWEPTLGVTTLPLQTLARAQSIRLLTNFLGETEPPTPDPIHHSPFTIHYSPFDAIAAELGDLPLALHLAGSFLERYRHAVTPEAYLTQLRSPDLLKHRSLQQGGFSPTGHEQSVWRTFGLSYNRLDAEQPVDALALRLLAHAAYFAPNTSIPRALLQASFEYEKLTNGLWQNIRRLFFDVKAGKPSDIEIDDALTRLAELGLVDMDAFGAPQLHRLVAQFVRQYRTDQEVQAVIEEMVYAQANLLNKAGQPSALLVWQPHLRYVTDRALKRGDEKAADLSNELGYHLLYAGDPAGARSYLEQALAIKRQVLGEQHLDTARSLNNFGAFLTTQGDLAAAQTYLEQALIINRQVLGNHHPDTTTTLNNLGSLLQDQGNLAAAKPYYEEALAIRRQVLGEQHPDTALCLNNLGSLIRAQGDLKGARIYLEQALAVRRQALGEEHPYTAESLNNLGSVLQDQGNLVEAQCYYHQALTIYRQALGEQHPATALSFNNLGSLLQAQGDLAAAQSYYAQALAIRRHALGEQHPETADSLNNLGGLLQAQGDLAAAQPYYEQALAIVEAKLGAEHPTTKTVRDNLAALLRALGSE